ncbi:MAG: peptidase S10, partial [Planctomycetota bacterium]|nr:peptidase S10 [Planctomycetota bacterium]
LGRFQKELLRKKERTCGRFDSRLMGIDRDSGGARYDYDPSMAAINGPFSATIKHYLRHELGYQTDVPYETLTGRVHPWSYRSYQNRYVNVGETLRQAMTKNPHLRVMLASGYYDLATPYFASDYTMNHLLLAPELRSHITTAYYEAGHMMYIHTPSREKLKRDVVAFYREALRGGTAAASKEGAAAAKQE